MICYFTPLGIPFMGDMTVLRGTRWISLVCWFIVTIIELLGFFIPNGLSLWYCVLIPSLESFLLNTEALGIGSSRTNWWSWTAGYCLGDSRSFLRVEFNGEICETCSLLPVTTRDSAWWLWFLCYIILGGWDILLCWKLKWDNSYEFALWLCEDCSYPTILFSFLTFLSWLKGM